MNRLRNCALILALSEKIKENGSWCGETHIQKSTFFLKTLANVPVDFDFILYKHGPFSFDLRDELTAMTADGLLAMHSTYPYGATLMVTNQGKELEKRYPKTLKKYNAGIGFVAEKLGAKGVVELEKLATALFVIKNRSGKKSKSEHAEMINEIKPHVSLQEAEASLTIVEGMIKEFAPIKKACDAVAD
jgi:uncharacterized protein YwgA